MKLYSIETGNLKLDGGAMFGVVPKVMWNKIYPADENNLCNWSMRCLLIADNQRVILIDTGMGDKDDEKFTKHYHLNGNFSLISSLEKIGYRPEDVTDIIHTHLHFDHCGGTIKFDSDKNLVPTFQNANLWVGEEHWELATNPNNREKASFLKNNILPMLDSGKLKFIEKEGEILPDVFVTFYNGHTRGQVIPTIKVNQKTIIFCGDLFPSSAHIPMPYIMGYDMWAEETLRDKERFFKSAMENNSVLFFEHDIYNECATLVQTDKGVKVDKTFKLENWEY
jgi:glyoxylase-like metal-dependent hydrolase (beta-lactamase superfamily II)